MPNIAQVLKQEITRIARREAKAAVEPVRKPTIKGRHDVADLKKRVAVLEKTNKQLQDRLTKLGAAQPTAPASEPAGREWISGKGIRSLRKRLGLSQTQFAKLAGVSDQAVYMWESKAGKLELRDATRSKVMAVRGIGIVEARARLAKLAETDKTKKVAAKGRKRK